jgi:hypothetical protein
MHLSKTNEQDKDLNKRVPSAVMHMLYLFLILLAFPVVALPQANAGFTEARTRLLSKLKMRNMDKSYSEIIDRFYFATCDSLINKKITIDERPIDVILTRLFDATNDNLKKRTLTSLRVPSVNNFFLLTIKNYKKQSILKLFREISISQSVILESAFDGTPLGDSITTFVGIREMISNPYFISTRLHQPRYATYRDTLLFYFANTAPEIFIQKLADNDSLFTSLVAKSRNMTVSAISQIKKDIHYDNILPFALAIAENRTSTELIKKLSLEPQKYYRAFVDEVIRIRTSQDAETRYFLKHPIIVLNKKFANKYFISEINMLHESPDKVRFKILDTLTTRELYFLITGGTGELYTSSLLFLYKEFIKGTVKTGLEKFLSDINYYQFDQFISNISGYGLVGDLVKHLEEGNTARILGKYLTSLSNRQLADNEIILNAMNMSDVLQAVRNHHTVRDMLLSDLATLEKANPNDILLGRMYKGFRDILLSKDDYKKDSTYDVLLVNRLQKNNSIVQVCFFYDDDDGRVSFDKSLATYEATLWDKKDIGNYVVLSSKAGNAMRIYMNKPLTKSGSDTTQDEMLRDISKEGYEVTSFIHRGHSYYLLQSIRKMTPSPQFVFLGSCGGYNEVLKVFQVNPDVNIISTRNIGSSLINDPLLQKINKDLVNNRNISWDEAWKEFNSMFQSKLTMDLFSSYIPPNKYTGVKFIRRVFNY